MSLAQLAAFANRLQKMYKHNHKWARRQNISCFRVYDCDIPQFPFSVDVYEDCVYVAEYKTSYPMTDSDHREWLRQCILTVSEILEVPKERVFLKKRQQQKGAEQYTKTSNRAVKWMAREGGLRFVVNLSDYLDTGLFLDHRQTRQMVKDEAADKRVLNLFAYTGAFTVYAAAGGAKSTTTIDLSKTYIEWAKDNMNLNGFTTDNHQFLQTDVLQYLAKPPAGAMFDLVILDPPTFSNSKRMFEVLDVQRDHVTLLNQALAITARGGVVYFSTNYRRFKMQTNDLHASVIKDITAQTIPPDFRDKRIHQCFRLVK
jgi:23S rRNA (cytosine1962-C5)-methyltransferase